MTGNTSLIKLSNVLANTDAFGYSARTASREAMISSVEPGGPVLSVLNSVHKATPLGASAQSPPAFNKQE